MSAILITGIALYVFLNVRNVLAHKWALRAINEAYQLNCADIDDGIYEDGTWRYDLIPSHAALMLDLTQWRYRSPFQA
jgi:hypothetical protein